MSKKKRNVFNLPEALYRGILEDVRNDPNLYVNPDPTVHEDIHYLAYTLYAQRPSDSELSRNYILALGKLGNLCDEIERRTGKLISRKVIDAAKAKVQKDKEARHAKEAEAHKNDKDFFGNPKPYVHKYWLYEEETEDTLALVELLKAYYSGKLSSFDNDEDEEVVELTRHDKSDKNKKKKVPEPEEELANEDFDDDDDEYDSDEDEDFDDDAEDLDDEDDDDVEDFEVGGFHVSRGRNYRAELANALDADDDEDDEDEDFDDDVEDDEEDEDEDDDRPTLRVPEVFRHPDTSMKPSPKEKSVDPFDDVESDDDEDDDDLDSVDLEAEQAEFDAWVARQNPDEVSVDIGSMAASSNSHRLADSDDELSDEDDDDEDDEKEEIPDDPYAKVRHLIPAGMEPDDYHRLIMRALAGAISYARNKPESNNTMKPDELFAYYSLKNPEATIRTFKDIPAYVPYLDKYLPGWNKGKAEAPKKEDAPAVKDEAPAKKPVEKVEAEIVEETPVKKPDINKPMTPAEFDAYAQGMVAEAKAKAAKEVEAYKKFRAEHPWPIKDDTKPGSPVVEIVEEEPEKVEVVDETKPEELEKDEITFAAGPRLTPDEANAIMDRAFGSDSEEVEDSESDEDDDDDEIEQSSETPYNQIQAFVSLDGDFDHVFKIDDGVNTVSINLDYLADSDPDAVEVEGPIDAGILDMITWFMTTSIHYRPSVILTASEYDSMVNGCDEPNPIITNHLCYRVGSRYVACYRLADNFQYVIRDLLSYLSDNNQLTSFFKKYIKIVSDLDGFSFLNTRRAYYGFCFDNILNSPMNDSDVKNAFISDFRSSNYVGADDFDCPLFANLAPNQLIGDENNDKAFYDTVFEVIYNYTHKVDDSADASDDEKPEAVPEIPQAVEENPNQEMANAANTLFTLTADKKVDLDDVGMVARKLQDFVNKEVAEARGKLNPEELVDDPDDDEEDDDDIEEEYFPNRRKEVKKASNPIKKPVQKPQKKNDDDDPNAFVIQRR